MAADATASRVVPSEAQFAAASTAFALWLSSVASYSSRSRSAAMMALA